VANSNEGSRLSSGAPKWQVRDEDGRQFLKFEDLVSRVCIWLLVVATGQIVPASQQQTIGKASWQADTLTWCDRGRLAHDDYDHARVEVR
jgi:hypothetical protein